MKNLMKRHPFFLITALGIALSWLGELFGIEYDSGGFTSLIFLGVMILKLLVNLAHEVVHGIPLLKKINSGEVVSLALGLSFALILDFAWRLFVRARSRSKLGKSTSASRNQ